MQQMPILWGGYTCMPNCFHARSAVDGMLYTTILYCDDIEIVTEVVSLRFLTDSISPDVCLFCKSCLSLSG